MTTTKVNLANTVEGILPVANGGTGSSTGVSPGGSTTQVQFNNAGAFGGDSGFVYTGGNVGIGTSSPATRLHLYGALNEMLRLEASSASYDAALRIFQNGTQTTNLQGGSGVVGGGTILYTVTNAPLVFGTNNTERMRIDASGYVLAGTTSNAPLSNAGYSGGAVFAGSTSAGLVIQGSRTADGSLGGLEWYNGSSTRMALIEGRRSGANNSSVLDFYSANAGSLVQAMRIDSSGRLLIGQTSPYDNATLSLTSASQLYSVIADGGTTGNRSRGGFAHPATKVFALNVDQADGVLAFYQNGNTERMRIDSSGNVGIGTSSPTALLHVNGTARASSISLNGVAISDYTLYQGLVARVGNGNGIGINSANSTDNAYIYFGYGTTSGQQQSAAIGRIGGDVLSFFTASSERLRIGSSGQFGIGGANYGTSGQVLTSNGSGSAPSWTTPSTSSGTVTSVATGNGLSGGTITTSGTLTVACPTAGSVGSYASCYSQSAYNWGSNYSQTYASAMENGGTQIIQAVLSGTWKWLGASVGGNGCQALMCRVS